MIHSFLNGFLNYLGALVHQLCKRLFTRIRFGIIEIWVHDDLVHVYSCNPILDALLHNLRRKPIRSV